LRTISGTLIVLGFLANRQQWFDERGWVSDFMLSFGFLGISAVKYLQLSNDRQRIDYLLQMLVIFIFLAVAGRMIQYI
jgi:hypothetical protein